MSQLLNARNVVKTVSNSFQYNSLENRRGVIFFVVMRICQVKSESGRIEVRVIYYRITF